MSSTDEAVVRMANQIALNLASQGEDAAAAQTAEHIRMFWDPRMRARALALIESPQAGLSPSARAALELLRAPNDANADA